MHYHKVDDATTILNPVGMEHAKVMYLMSKAELREGAHCTECLVHGEEMGQSFLPSFQSKTGGFKLKYLSLW